MFALIVALVVVFFPFPAYAYLDPGTGGMALQALLAALAAGLVAIKTWWRQIKDFFQKRGEDD